MSQQPFLKPSSDLISIPSQSIRPPSAKSSKISTPMKASDLKALAGNLFDKEEQRRKNDDKSNKKK